MDKSRNDQRCNNVVRPRPGDPLESGPDRLDKEALKRKGIHYHAVLDSTNNAARKLAEREDTGFAVIIAEAQQRGRGRLGRTWDSPPGVGLWFSILLKPARLCPAATAPLTLVTAATLAGRLKAETGLEVSVKWPNDLMLNGKKTGGILTELKAEPDRVTYLVIGIGLNVNHKLHDFAPELHSRATSLYLESGFFCNRTALFFSLIDSLEQSYHRFWETGFAPFRQAWKEVNSTLGTKVTVSSAGGTLQGKAVDLDQQGALIVEDAAGKIHYVSSGEVE